MIKDKLSPKINIYYCTRWKTATSEDIQCLLKILSNCTRPEFLKVFIYTLEQFAKNLVDVTENKMNSSTTMFGSCYNE